jgi:hypothetical protein
MSDIREIYQAKQAAGKIKRINYDETKNRDEVDRHSQIRSYPMAASTSPERQLKDSSTNIIVNQTSSTSVIKKSKLIGNIFETFYFVVFFSFFTSTIC